MKLVDDIGVAAKEKDRDRYWKIRPLLKKFVSLVLTTHVAINTLLMNR